MVKTITIKDDVYERLSEVKGEDESFSELLERLVEGGDSRKILASLRASVEFKDKQKLLKEMAALRAERRL